MALWSRLVNVFRGDRVLSEIDEELRSHIEEGIARGRDPEEVERAFGSRVRLRETSRDLRIVPWLESLRADVAFGWRQIVKRKATAAAAILSLALAIGACTSAFRLIDALLLRPLPVAGAERLYSVTFESPSAIDGTPTTYDSCSYPMFLRMRADVKDQAELIGISLYNGPADVTYGADRDMERVNLQYVSAWMFDTFGLKPAIGRLLTSDDDRTPGSHPYAVISHDYWTRRFDRNAGVVGRTFRAGNDVYEIVGVANEGFTGTETGWTTDVFIPMAMKNPRILASLNNFWLRTLVQLKPGVTAGPVESRLRATFHAIQEERAKSFPAQTQRDRERLFQEKLSLEPASAGRSNMQIQYRQALVILGILVALVLLITCVNLANLMTGQAASRAREMAVRVSIGAGRWRLVQLVLIESAWLALLATVVGAALAWWEAPFIVRMINPPAYAARLILPLDWRVSGFVLILACGVTFLFGLMPAVRASAIKPASVLRGGEDTHWRGHLMRSLISVQVAFCFVVHLAAGLFVTTFEHLSNQPTGFSAERVLNLETVTSAPQLPIFWEQVAEQLRTVSGVERVALIGWPLMSGESAVGNIAIHGGPPSEVFSDFVTISPGWADLMQIPLLDGRDFKPADVNPRVAIVNQSFAKQYFNGENPVGREFDRVEAAGGRSHYAIVGLIQDARSRDRMRVAIRPTAYIPFPSIASSGTFQPVSRGTFVVRTVNRNPLALASTLRNVVTEARSGFRVRDMRTQVEFDQTDTVKERLLAVLAAFFSATAVLLAGVGLYGVLSYSVLRRRKEIGIRIAIGARNGDIVHRVIVEPFIMVVIGGTAGLGLGIALMKYVESLLFQVRPTDVAMLALPSGTILVATILAALPAVIRALKIDPAKMLRDG
jgi:predicted permease